MTASNSVGELIENWRTLAETMRKCGAESSASALEYCARELASALELAKLEALSLEDAAKESGYSYSSIQKRVASGELTNVGKKGSPKVRRGESPPESSILPRPCRCHPPPPGQLTPILVTSRFL